MSFGLLDQSDRSVNFLTVDRPNNVLFLQSSRSCRRVRLNFIDNRRFGRKDEQLPNAFSSPTSCLGFVRLDVYRANFAIALELDRNCIAFTAYDRPAHAVVHAEKTRDTFSINLQNFVTRVKLAFSRRRIRHHVSDHRRHVGLAHRITGHPHNAREHDRE